MNHIEYPEKMVLFVGREEDGNVMAILNGKVLDPKRSQSFVNHSPDGFNYGYLGSGPAQLALACCLELLPIPLALSVYQVFKEKIISGIDGNADHSTITFNFHKFLASVPDRIMEWQASMVVEGPNG